FRGTGQSRGNQRGNQNPQYQRPQNQWDQSQNPQDSQGYDNYTNMSQTYDSQGYESFRNPQYDRGRGFYPRRRFSRYRTRFRGRGRRNRYGYNSSNRGNYNLQNPYDAPPPYQANQQFDFQPSYNPQQQYQPSNQPPPFQWTSNPNVYWDQFNPQWNPNAQYQRNQYQQQRPPRNPDEQHLHVCTICHNQGHLEDECHVGRKIASHLLNMTPLNQQQNNQGQGDLV
ncbi:MAG: hypothetical protein MJA29_06525, partial [Candidatus Omnitrophica bacterium]|nr:hypothetical protein [Candidatus Omnitrophota bacterium]